MVIGYSKQDNSGGILWMSTVSYLGIVCWGGERSHQIWCYGASLCSTAHVTVALKTGKCIFSKVSSVGDEDAPAMVLRCFPKLKCSRNSCS